MDSVSNAIWALSLIIIMFGMGLSLSIGDFAAVFQRPKAIIIGLICQLILLPIVGFSLIDIFSLQLNIAIGIIILFACPGGLTSNLITHLANGDTALSVSMTAVCSFITLLTIPFIITLGLQKVLGAGTLIRLNVSQTILQVFLVVIVSVALGMLLRSRRQKFSLQRKNPVKRASSIFFVVVFIAVIIKERALLFSSLDEAGLFIFWSNQR